MTDTDPFGGPEPDCSRGMFQLMPNTFEPSVFADPDFDPYEGICQHRIEETTYKLSIDDGCAYFMCTQCEKPLNPDFLSEFNDIIYTGENFNVIVKLSIDMDSGSYEEPPEPTALRVDLECEDENA